MTPEKPLASFDHRIILSDGAIRWQHWTHRALYSSEGEWLETQAVGMDITGGVETENSRRAAEVKYRAISENAPVGIYQSTPEGKILSANKEYARILGYDSPEDLVAQVTDIGKDVYVDPAQRVALSAMLDAAGTVENYEALNKHKDGSMLWTMRNVRQVQDIFGTVTYEGFLLNIDKRKRAEEALLESQATSRALLNAPEESVLLLDAQARILDINKAGIALLGLKGRKIKGKHAWELLQGGMAESCRHFFSKALAKGTPISFEAKMKEQVFEVAQYPILNAYGEFSTVALFVKDITQRKELEQRLEESREVAIEASRAKSEFLARMSHEIRTPLNAVIGLTEVTLQTSLKGEQRDYLETVRDSAEHLLLVINDILDLSKIEARKLELEQRDFDLIRALSSTVRTLNIQASKKGLALDLLIAEDVPRFIKGDVGRIRQILINLIGNAIKFTAQGEIVVAVSLVPSTKELSDDSIHLAFEVKDTGVGIPEDKLKTVFDAFTQADTSITRKYGGTGLGLPICRELVRMMHGDIQVESILGFGSVFGFTIVCEPGDPRVVEPEAEQHDACSQQQSLKILVADDNPVNQKVALAFLKRYGHTATMAEDGLQALQFLAAEPFDLVLMDVEMPDMNGLDATRCIRAGQAGEQNKNIPVIAMTAHALAGFREQCLAAGMNDYVAKPMDFKELDGIINRTVSMAQRDWSWSSPTAKTFLVLNTEQALKRLDGDESLLFEINKIFQTEFPKRLTTLRETLQILDAPQVKFLAHSLKNLAGTVGAEVCLQEAMHLEEAAKTGELSDAAERVAKLEAAYADVWARMAGEVSDVLSSNSPGDRRRAKRCACDILVTLRDPQGVVLPIRDVNSSGVAFHAEGYEFSKGQRLIIDISKDSSLLVEGLHIEIVWSFNGIVGSKVLSKSCDTNQKSFEKLLTELGVSSC